jgi:hypothetical protein
MIYYNFNENKKGCGDRDRKREYDGFNCPDLWGWVRS